MSKLRELEKLLAYLENPTDRTDRSPFRQFCQSTSLDISKVFSSGEAKMEGAGCPTNGRAAREVAERRKFAEYLKNPTDKTDRSTHPSRCAWCGEGERSGAMIVPFGTETIGHTWLHSECLRDWYAKRGAGR